MSRARRLESAAVAALAPVLVLAPVWLAALVLYWAAVRPLLSQIGMSVPWWAPALMWIASGTGLFVQPIQVAVLSPALAYASPCKGWVGRKLRSTEAELASAAVEPPCGS